MSAQSVIVIRKECAVGRRGGCCRWRVLSASECQDSGVLLVLPPTSVAGTPSAVPSCDVPLAASAPNGEHFSGQSASDTVAPATIAIALAGAFTTERNGQGGN